MRRHLLGNTACGGTCWRTLPAKAHVGEHCLRRHLLENAACEGTCWRTLPAKALVGEQCLRRHLLENNACEGTCWRMLHAKAPVGEHCLRRRLLENTLGNNSTRTFSKDRFCCEWDAWNPMLRNAAFDFALHFAALRYRVRLWSATLTFQLASETLRMPKCAETPATPCKS